MRLLIVGANGKTGTQLVDLALAREHEVTAFVRSPAKVTRRHQLLKVFGVILSARMSWRKRFQGITRDTLPSGAFSMSFRALAAFMLDTVEHHAHVHQIVSLARLKDSGRISSRMKVTSS